MLAATVILAVFAAIWGVMAVAVSGGPAWTMVGPALVSTALALFVLRSLPPEQRGAAENHRIRRLVAVASTAEGVGIFLGVNLVAWMGRPELTFSVIAAGVGLHLLPMARWLPARIYYLTAAGLLALAAAGLVLPVPVRGVVVCSGAAIVLWATIASFVAAPRPQAVPA